MPNLEVIAVFPQTTDEFAKYIFVNKSGKTNAQGSIRFTERTLLNPSVGVKLSKYYSSGRAVDLDASESGRREGKWLPFPFIERLMLKKIGNPVPMYALANLTLILPKEEGAFGFDLEKRDWVAPHGTGVKSDLIFTQDKKTDIVIDSTAMLRIGFTNPGDGLIPLYELEGRESELNLPRTAPLAGYQAEQKLATDWNSRRQHTPPAKPALGYLYRVRTVLDDKG